MTLRTAASHTAFVVSPGILSHRPSLVLWEQARAFRHSPLPSACRAQVFDALIRQPVAFFDEEEVRGSLASSPLARLLNKAKPVNTSSQDSSIAVAHV